MISPALAAKLFEEFNCGLRKFPSFERFRETVSFFFENYSGQKSESKYSIARTIVRNPPCINGTPHFLSKDVIAIEIVHFLETFVRSYPVTTEIKGSIERTGAKRPYFDRFLEKFFLENYGTKSEIKVQSMNKLLGVSSALKDYLNCCKQSA